MEYREIAKLLNKLNRENDDATMSKIMELVAGAAAYDKLQNLASSKRAKFTPETIKVKRRNRVERQAKVGKTFKITKKEIDVMLDRYKNLFACSDRIVHYRFHKGVYEAHYRRFGLDIYASAKDFNEMREKFIRKLLNITANAGVMCLDVSPKELMRRKNANIPFMNYVDEWLKIKKQTVKESTYKEYERTAEYNFRKNFAKHTVGQVTRSVIQDYLFGIVKEGKYRTAEKVHLAFTCIFDLISEDLGVSSPMKKIVLPYYEAKKGNALTKDEEKQLVEYCLSHSENEASSAILVLLHFGLRRSELKTIEVKDETLTCVTSKTKLGRNEVKRTIPFTPVFRRVLESVDFEKAKRTNVHTIQTTFKKIFSNHHVHELRYTFITRAKEAGCNQEVVMLWAGHSFDKDVKTSVVDRGYTDYSKEYMKAEAQKINYII